MKEKLLNSQSQYYFLLTIFTTAFFVLDLFYSVLVFKETSDIKLLIWNSIIIHIVAFIVYVIGNYIILKTSSSFLIRLSFLTMTLSGVFGYFMLNKIPNFFLIFPILRGISSGLYWVPTNIIALDGIHKATRSRLFFFLSGSNSLIAIIVPIILGFYLDKSDNYKIVFVLFSLVSLLGIFFPWTFNGVKNLSFKISNFIKIFKKKGFLKFITLKSGSSLMWVMGGLSGYLLPYIILGNEASMGIYLTITALIGSLIAFTTINLQLKKKRSAGLIGIFIENILNIVLAFNLLPIWLYITSIFGNIISPIVTPSEDELSLAITDKFEIKDHISIELCLLREFIYFSSGVLINLVLLFILGIGIDYKILLIGSLISSSVIRLFLYSFTWLFVKN